MAKEKIKDLLYWLELVLKLAEKEGARLHQAGRENFGLNLDFKNITRTEIKKYLSRSTKERMKRDGILLAQELRVWAMPSPWTFSIYPIKKLLERYVGDGEGWIDPFSGKSFFAETTNDHNPKMKAMYNLEALDFVKMLTGRYKGILFDPPYSFRQISEHYKVIGQKATQKQTSMAFYEKVKSASCEKIQIGGYAISFGWNTNGFGKARGFRIIEIMSIAHGGSKNDTVATVEIKLN